ncbi:hypothetical protein PIB30_013864 [Stylosanthes scabra]|uniref:Uncharacterized protein n=1 Tax=Stylosanthes scabra TaxID=79078 RepID=A0ABU6U6S5_9FABA|nr:hypothetical protein [Stylosanthes scabra]
MHEKKKRWRTESGNKERTWSGDAATIVNGTRDNGMMLAGVGGMEDLSRGRRGRLQWMCQCLICAHEILTSYMSHTFKQNYYLLHSQLRFFFFHNSHVFQRRQGDNASGGVPDGGGVVILKVFLNS